MAKKNHAVQFSTVAKVLLISLFLGGSGVGYVLQKGQIRTLRMEREENARQIQELSDKLRRVDAELETAKGRAEILLGLERHNIELGPTDWQFVVTLPEPGEARRRADLEIARN